MRANLAQKKKPKLKSTKIDESKSHSSEINNQNKEEISKPKDDEKIQETVLERKLSPNNWLAVFDKTDLIGPSRAFFF
jgi:hypothetical protein